MKYDARMSARIVSIYVSILIGGSLLLHTNAHADDPWAKWPENIRTLSNAKSIVEGRAGLVQGCRSQKAEELKRMFEAYEDVRSLHNAFIDGLVSAIRINSEAAIDEAISSIERLNVIGNKIEAFVEMVTKTKCPMAVKTGAGRTIAGWIVPVMGALGPLLSDLLTGDDEKRKKAIEDLERLKIVPWTAVRRTVLAAYDWSSEQYHSINTIHEPFLNKGGVVLYVNKWGLVKPLPRWVLTDKERPWDLGESWQAYGGRPADLGEFAYVP